MKSKLLASCLALALAGVAHAQFNPIPLTPGSFTRDVIVEKTAPPPAQTLVTANMDAGTNLAGLSAGGGNGGNQGSFYEIGFGTTAGSGLPYHGSTFKAFSNTNHIFQMPPDYTKPNAIFVGGAGTVVSQVATGTFTLTTPAAYTHLSILNAAGNGPVTLVYTVTYVDGSQEQGGFSVPDWFATNGTATNFTAYIANGNFQGSDGSYQNVNLNGGKQALERIRLYYNDIALGNSSLAVSNISFSFNGTGGRVAIFGMSGSTDGAQTFNPVTVTGYDYDMIIEAPLNKTVTATMDAGTNKTGNTWFEQGFNLIVPANTLNSGLPHPGATFTAVSNANVTFQMPPSYTNNNAMLVNNQFQSGTFTLTTPATYAALTFLESAGNGPVTNNYTINYADGSTQNGTIVVQDWFSSVVTNNAYLAGGRVPIDQLNAINNSGTTTGTKLFFDTIGLNNTNSAVNSVTLSYIGIGTGRTCTLAVSGDSTGSGVFSPIPVTGYNADMIVEASAITNMDERAFTTATMDGGTNNNANTWYEQGWNPLEPNSGLPPAGSTMTSVTLPDHHYQLAADYTMPNAVYADSNSPSATITFANPTNYSAVSFLSANANGGIRVKVILNHVGAPSETNYFDSKDWFSGTPYAFISAGRLSSDNRSANNYIPTSTNPRLYEAQFALQDTVHNVSGATLVWTTNASSTTTNFASATSRFVVFAVSGTLGAVAPIIGNQPVGVTNYEGVNFVVSATVTGGTAPITYQWQKSSVGGNVWTNVTDGGAISGSTTTNLTFTGAYWTNTGDYRLVATDIAGSTPTLQTTVQIFSSLPDISTSTDPISEFGVGFNPDPAAETVNHAIDGLVGTDPGKWLCYGGNGGATPFSGPVGFITSPQKGNTIASAVRLYTANDHPERDPADFTLEGSLDGGNTWTTIVTTPLNLPAARNAAASAAKNPLTQAVQEVHFANTNGYTTYRITFNNAVNNTTANSLAIGEVELLGGLTPVAPTIERQPVSTVTVYAGASPSFNVLAAGPSPLTYQWVLNGSTSISGATNSSYTFPNAQLSDDGKTFSCSITDPYGTTVSSSTLLHVIAVPTNLYPSSIAGDHPVAYWRLNEGPDDGNGNNGVIANDFVGGHDGVYTNVVLGVTGPCTNDPDTGVSFYTLNNSPSYVGAINGLNFATPTNTSGNLSVEAWVNGRQTQFAGAGIVALGYGGGGEEFALDCGGTSNSYRFYFRDAGAASHVCASPATATINSTDGLWHHLVGVVNETGTNEILYIDGLPVVTNSLAAGLGVNLPNPLFPLFIGARSTLASQPVPTNQFAGEIDEVAVYNYALTPTQVRNHYFAAGIPPIFQIAPTNVTASEGTSATFTAVPYGSPTLSLQWYNSAGGNPTTAVAGQTNNTFTLANVAAGQNGNTYQAVVTNAYGSVTSSPVTLTVISGPPQILADLQPAYTIFGGSELALSVNAGGTPPLSYYWYYNSAPLNNGVRVSGANTSTLTIVNAQKADAGSYMVVVSNSFGTVQSAVATVAVESSLAFDGGVTWTMNGGATYPSTNELELTDGTGSEARSSFFQSPVGIAAFQASFTYQDVGGAGADGAAFVIQNDSRGAAALGGAGGSLGYSGITPSAAVEFNIYANNTVGYAFRANGAIGGPYTPSTPVNIASGDPINVTLQYYGGVLTMTLADTTSNLTYTVSTNINIPAIVGRNTAYVGITAADGGTASTQTITGFTFVGITGLQTQVVGNNLVISWPVGLGSYVLQSSTSVQGGWADVNPAVTVVNGQNQVALPIGNGTAFYRLRLKTQ